MSLNIEKQKSGLEVQAASETSFNRDRKFL